MRLPATPAIAELVRLPAVLSVPGDPLLGLCCGCERVPARRAAGMVVASSCLYLGGMALNDYADREDDAIDRPERPIPSGRIEPRFARTLGWLLVSGGLTAAGVAGGRRGIAAAAGLAAMVHLYDFVLKDTPAGPAAMAACRSLDVFLGASPGSLRRAGAAASVVGAHTLAITAVSRHEAHGGTPAVAGRALAATAGVVAAASAVTVGGLGRRHGGERVARAAVAAMLLGAYGARMAAAERTGLRDPSARSLRGIVRNGILTLPLLEAALLASFGPPWAAAGVAAMWPAARRLSRRVAVT